MITPKLLTLLLPTSLATTPLFDYETIYLSEDDVSSNPSVAFGNLADPAPAEAAEARCKPLPGDEYWPIESEWDSLNATVGGQLLHPLPAAAACYEDLDVYDEDQCSFVRGPALSTNFYIEDPLFVMNSWPLGNKCPFEPEEGDTCTQGGFPEYVVNVTSAKDVQAAVNFARNKGLRLNVKNTGHEFNGKNTGRGSLSIWTHFLKGIEFIEDYCIGQYHGPVVKIGAGVETWEIHNEMLNTGDFTVVSTGGANVGQAGGWALGGGHSPVSSYYGMGADQVLEMNIITASGKFLRLTPRKNKELFYAMRGGGGSTFGIVLSMTVKAHPGRLPMSGLSYSFTTGPTLQNVTTNSPFPFWASTVIPEVETFWSAVEAYIKFTYTLTTELGGFGFGDITPVDGNGSFTFASGIAIPGRTAEEAAVLIAPLFEEFVALGVDIEMHNTTTREYSTFQSGLGGGSGPVDIDLFFASRLFPKQNWEDPALFSQTFATIRDSLENNIRIRCRSFYASMDVAGWPTSEEGSAVNPVLRDSLLHATIYPPFEVDGLVGPEAWLARHDILESYMALVRGITPLGGAYLNEADVLEPEWQESFFGEENYERLLGIKQKYDPWGVFWQRQTVGSEGWQVETEDGLPGQNGPLCKV